MQEFPKEEDPAESTVLHVPRGPTASIVYAPGYCLTEAFAQMILSALKAAAVDVGTAEAILGHSSGSISYDLYGAGSAVQVHRIAEALKVALT